MVDAKLIGVSAFVVLLGTLEFCRQAEEGAPAIAKSLYFWENTGKFGTKTGSDIAAGHDLSGQVAIVTGANTGLGKETARVLCSIGAHVTLACRNATKCAQTKAEIEATKPKGTVSTADLDLGSLKSVTAFAKAFKSQNSRLDLLINNAGVMDLPRYDVTNDGFERQFGVNHMGHFHLTNMLLETLNATGTEHGSARVINLSSLGHLMAMGFWGTTDLDWSHLPLKRDNYNSGWAYGISKTANVLHALQLRKILDGTNVKVAVGHPGIIDTELARNSQQSKFFYSRFVEWAQVFMGKRIKKSIPQGTATTLCMALNDLPKSVNNTAVTDGLFFMDCLDVKDQPGRAAEHIVFDQETAEVLWARSTEMVHVRSAIGFK